MTREDIIRMYAKANGWSPAAFTDTLEELERFAALVASAERERIEHAAIGSVRAAILYEREACAKVCEEQADDGTEGEWDGCCLSLAKQIRARGQA